MKRSNPDAPSRRPDPPPSPPPVPGNCGSCRAAIQPSPVTGTTCDCERQEGERAKAEFLKAPCPISTLGAAQPVICGVDPGAAGGDMSSTPTLMGDVLSTLGNSIPLNGPEAWDLAWDLTVQSMEQNGYDHNHPVVTGKQCEVADAQAFLHWNRARGQPVPVGYELAAFDAVTQFLLEQRDAKRGIGAELPDSVRGRANRVPFGHAMLDNLGHMVGFRRYVNGEDYQFTVTDFKQRDRDMPIGAPHTGLLLYPEDMGGSDGCGTRYAGAHPFRAGLRAVMVFGAMVAHRPGQMP